MAFDYTVTDTPDDVVRAIANEMSDGGLKPLSDEERLERQIWREEQAFLAQERLIERERQQAEIEAAARHEQALALAEDNRRAREKAHQEYLARQERQGHSNVLAVLQSEAQQSAAWRNAVRNAIAYQNRMTLMNELEAALAPPAPPPSPEPTTVVVVEGEQEQPKLGYPNLHRWF
jgi:hypothetical protein